MFKSMRCCKEMFTINPFFVCSFMIPEACVKYLISSIGGKQLWLYFYEMMYDVHDGIVIISIIYIC